MTGISSSVGLVSGIDYTSLIDKLMEVERIPVANLETRTKQLELQEQALTNVTALFLTSSYMIENINKADAWNRCDVTSSNPTLLTVTSDKVTVPGVYTFTPLQTAMAQQTVAQGVNSDTKALGKEGTITIGPGWSLENDVTLNDLNGGSGISKGYIRITDGSGTRATIDLRTCTTMSQVIDKINNTDTIDVWAELDGDKLILLDQSGGDPSKLLVQEVNNGKTAASLGLLGKEPVDGVITGNDLYRLSEKTLLSSLNDGTGLVFDNSLSDLIFTCKDGSKVTIDFNKATSGVNNVTEINYEHTIGDLIKTVADAEGNNGKITLEISSDGKGLVFKDTTKKFVSGLDTDDDTDPNFPYTLPPEFSDASRYKVDEDGFVVENVGLDDQSEIIWERVGDSSATTSIEQPGNVTRPIMRTLGLIEGKYSIYDRPTSSAGVFETRQLIGSLDSPLMSSLNGGYGLNSAISATKAIEALNDPDKTASIEVQDRDGNTATLTFTAAELKEIHSGSLTNALKTLNGKLAAVESYDAGGALNTNPGVNLRFEINDTKTGLKIVDETSSSNKAIVFRDVAVTYEEDDGTGTMVEKTLTPAIASTLGFNVESTQASSVTGKSLNLQTIGYDTKLSDLNGGLGVVVTGGRILMTDGKGKSGTAFLDSKLHTTVGDIIDQINGARSKDGTGLMVQARINDAGDGILIEDLSGGDGNLTVIDGNSNSKIVSGLKLDRTSTKDPVTGRQVVDGSMTHTIEVKATDSLEDIRVKINKAGGNFTATTIIDGTTTPYRLAISGGTTGAAGAMNIDLSCLGLATENMTEAQDAILVYGDATSSNGVPLHSSTNTFKNVINGVDVTILGKSDTPITVTSARSSTDIKASLQAFVENYNSFREQLNTQMYYDTSLEMGNPLHNDSVALAYDTEIPKLLQQRVYGINGVQSLQSIGISIRSSSSDGGLNTQTGKLTFDEKVFDELWATNRDGMMEFFFKEREVVDSEAGLDKDGNVQMKTVKTGWAQNFMEVAESITGNTSGTVLGKVGYALQTLDDKITDNYERIEFLEARLDVKKQQMLNKFYAMETAMAQMSTDMSTISAIATNWSSNYSSGASG